MTFLSKSFFEVVPEQNRDLFPKIRVSFILQRPFDGKETQMEAGKENALTIALRSEDGHLPIGELLSEKGITRISPFVSLGVDLIAEGHCDNPKHTKKINGTETLIKFTLPFVASEKLGVAPVNFTIGSNQDNIMRGARMLEIGTNDPVIQAQSNAWANKVIDAALTEDPDERFTKIIELS